MSLFPVELVTPSQLLFSGQATEAVLPCSDGQRGILPGHTDFVGRIGAGPLKLVGEGKELWFVVRDGVFEVKDRELVILVAIGERAEEVNSEASQQRLKEIEQVLAKMNRAVDDPSEVEQLRDFEKAKIEVSKHSKTK